MELIAAVVILAILGILAQRFGYDSRDGVLSKEHDLSQVGLRWDATREQMRNPRARDTPRPLDVGPRRRRIRRSRSANRRAAESGVSTGRKLVADY